MRATVASAAIDPALVEEFLDWQQRLTDAERAFPGFGGSELFRQVPGVQEDWTAVFRFDTEEHLNDWLESPDRKRLLDEGAHFQKLRAASGREPVRQLVLVRKRSANLEAALKLRPLPLTLSPSAAREPGPGVLVRQ